MVISEWVRMAFLPGNFIAAHPMINSKWVALPFCMQPGSLISYMTNSLWVTPLPFFCQAVSSYLIHNKQQVSDKLLLFCQGASSHLIPWPTGCEWHCPFFVKQSHHISSHEQSIVCEWHCHFSVGHSLITLQFVSDAAFSQSHLIQVSPAIVGE